MLKNNAPLFATIAGLPDFELSEIVMFLLNPHPKMPNMSLSRTEAADLAVTWQPSNRPRLFPAGGLFSNATMTFLDKADEAERQDTRTGSGEC